MSGHLRTALLCVAAVGALGCDETPAQGGGGAGGEADRGGGDPFASGAPLAVPTGDEPTYVDLDRLAVVTADDAWDLRFEGAQIFTNGGVSGEGEGGAFGPLDLGDFSESSVPADIPFLFDDEEGGAFLDWYAYDSANHLLYSRFHVFGVRRGEQHYKIQVLGFYGEAEGAPVSALYQVRFAVLSDGEIGATQAIEVDGSAGGIEPGPDDPSGCVNLGTGEQTLLTPAEAEASPDWDLCFRRAVISVNGAPEAKVQAVDLMSGATAGESLADVMEKTAASELGVFDAVDSQALSGSALEWLSDGVFSAFSGEWLVAGSDPLEPALATWLVAGADGVAPFFVGFESLEGAAATSVGTVHLRVKKLEGSLP
jgi:hypothetical protein